MEITLLEDVDLASIMAILILAIIILLLRYHSLKKKVRELDEFHEGVLTLIHKGVLPGVDRISFKQDEDGYILSFRGSHGTLGPNHTVRMVVSKSGNKTYTFPTDIT